MKMEQGIRVGEVSHYYGASGRPLGYQVEIWHDGLNEHRALRDKDIDILESKVNSQLGKWQDKWERILTKQEQKELRERGKESAEIATAEAEAALEQCENILSHTLNIDDRVDWESLKRKEPFVYQPAERGPIVFGGRHNEPKDFERVARPRKPSITDDAIKANKGFFDKLLPPLGKRKDKEAEGRLEAALKQWKSAVERADAENSQRVSVLEKHRQLFLQEKQEYEDSQSRANAQVDELKKRYLEKDLNALEEHAELVLNSSDYPDWMRGGFEIFGQEGGVLVVDYQLPEPTDLPSLKKVAYIASRDETTEKHISGAQKKKLYDSVIYQVALRTMHELFEADEIEGVKQVTFNGWVNSIDPATGQMATKCIVTVQATKEEFLAFDLANVDPKACFRRLKGVSAASLVELAPVTPILRFNRGDARFVESKDVVDSVDHDTNLAAMPWEDFEHLVRELFQKHFEGDGGEVHVTQASRDGGVDAIAFDPDPIRGGKLVIQAKRYTNTVGVSAVRDLYGTVVNEGAVKGILITTSDYGPDAYAFAKDKPLTLLNGSNLLHLLQEHGYRAKIDITEAKRVAKEAG